MERKSVGAPFAGIRRRKDTTVPKKRNSGITLIALVITIIIMLILAGIVITLAIGNNEIINKAQIAGKNYLEAQNYEVDEIAKTNNEIDEYVNGTRKENSNYYFIDTSKLITSFGITATNNSYTAKEDCYITAYLHQYGQQTITITINDQQISYVLNNTDKSMIVPFSIGLAKGDTIKFKHSVYRGSSKCYVWGLK